MVHGGGAAVLTTACIIASGCQPQLPHAESGAGPEPSEVRVDPRTCEEDAVRLTMPADVRTGPDAEADAFLHLNTGAFLYLCETRGGYRAVLFPYPGESVDCAAHPCQAGWVREPIAIELYG
jgi:hypothetical protein